MNAVRALLTVRYGLCPALTVIPKAFVGDMVETRDSRWTIGNDNEDVVAVSRTLMNCSAFIRAHPWLP